MKKFTTKMLARAGVVAAAYIAITYIFAPISFGVFQFRVSEALCILPLFFPECSIGLIIGCLISNMINSTPIDVVLGTTATALAAFSTALVGIKVKNKVASIVLGELPPILFNAFIVPFTFLSASDTVSTYFLGALSVGVGQLVVISTLGTLIAIALIKRNFVEK